jgi:hypothetical protein
MNIDQYLGRVPDFTEFPTVDELRDRLGRLAAAHPDVVRTRRIGTSRLGEPLDVLTVGDGPVDVVVIGGPHPNEPVGFLTVRTLVELLCADPALRAALGCRWHLVPCADPDGARLNEGWYGRPGDRRAYVDNFHRPDFVDQVEWTFPLAGDYHFDRTLPETQALMALMDEVRPSLVHSLHNGEYQGAFFYLNREDPELAGRLAGLARGQGIPLHHGEPELPGATVIAPAVYLTPAGTQVGPLFGAGGSSADYANRFGALHLVVEVPYWADDRVADRRPGTRPLGEVIAEAAVMRHELVVTLRTVMSAVADDLVVPSPFRRSAERTLESFRRLAELHESAPGPDRTATVAEEFGHRQAVHLLRLRLAAVFARMLDAELAAGNGTVAVREQRRLLGARLEQWYAEAEAEPPGRPVELRKLVAVQVGAALLAAAHATGSPVSLEPAPRG